MAVVTILLLFLAFKGGGGDHLKLGRGVRLAWGVGGVANGGAIIRQGTHFTHLHTAFAHSCTFFKVLWALVQYYKLRCHNTPGHTFAHCCVLLHTLAHFFKVLNAPIHSCTSWCYDTLGHSWQLHTVLLLYTFAYSWKIFHTLAHSAHFILHAFAHTLTNRGAIIQHQTLWRNVSPFFSTSHYDPQPQPKWLSLSSWIWGEQNKSWDPADWK